MPIIKGFGNRSDSARAVFADDAAASAEVATTARLSKGGRVKPVEGVDAASRAEAHDDATASRADCIVIAFHGELDISNKHSIEEELGRIERFAASAPVILDLSDVAYLDTTFLNVLLRTERATRRREASRVLVVVPGKSFVSRVFAIAKLEKRFNLVDDIGTARRYLSTAVSAIHDEPA